VFFRRTGNRGPLSSPLGASEVCARGVSPPLGFRFEGGARMGGVEGGETSAGGESVPAVWPRAIQAFLIYGFCATCACEERAVNGAPGGGFWCPAVGFQGGEKKLFPGFHGEPVGPPVCCSLVQRIKPCFELSVVWRLWIGYLWKFLVHVVVTSCQFAHVRALLNARTRGCQPRAGGKRAAFYAAFAFSTGEPRERRFAALHIV